MNDPVTTSQDSSEISEGPLPRVQILLPEALRVQYRDANCAFYEVQVGSIRQGAGSRMPTVDDGRPGAGTRTGDEARLGGCRSAS